MKQKLYDLMNRRTTLIQQAEDALNANNHSGYQSAMEQITNLNQEIAIIQALIAEQDRKMLNAPAPTGSEAEDIAHERVSALMRGDEVTFTVNEVRRALHNQVTVATGTIVQPTGVGTDIRDPLGNVVPSIVDRVRTLDLTGLGSWQEPYVITELDAKGGKVETTAGTARPTSTDPTFGVAEIKPYELTVTTFVDRNIARLSPTAYYEKIQGMAMRAMRRNLAALIVNGDDPNTPVFYGVTNAKNKAAANIFAEETLGTAVDVNTLDALYEVLRDARSSGADLRSQVAVVFSAGGVATVTSGSAIESSQTISASQVERYLQRDDVHTYYSTVYACSYLTYTNGSRTTTVWYQSPESLQAKLALCRLFGVTHYVLQDA